MHPDLQAPRGGAVHVTQGFLGSSCPAFGPGVVLTWESSSASEPTLERTRSRAYWYVWITKLLHQ